MPLFVFSRSAGLIYEGVLQPPKGKLPDDWEPRPQTLFRATLIGDDVDRPLRKSDGSWTYFAADIAYHLEQVTPRLSPDDRRLGRRPRRLRQADAGGGRRRHRRRRDPGCQAVPARQSSGGRRAGQNVEARRHLRRVAGGRRPGRSDVFRFIMLTRKNDAPLDFDFRKVTEQSRTIPCSTVQYAHARCRSVLRHAESEFGGPAVADEALAGRRAGAPDGSGELFLIKQLASGRTSSRAPPKRTNRTASPFTCKTWHNRYTACGRKGRRTPNCGLFIRMIRL